jgi:hypothetical protein
MLAECGITSFISGTTWAMMKQLSVSPVLSRASHSGLKKRRERKGHREQNPQWWEGSLKK